MSKPFVFFAQRVFYFLKLVTNKNVYVIILVIHILGDKNG